MLNRRKFLMGMALGAAYGTAMAAKSAIPAKQIVADSVRIGIYPGELENGALYSTVMGNYEPFIDHLRSNGIRNMTYLVETNRAAWPQHLVRESYDFVYLPPQYAVTARLLGYEVLAKSDSSIQPVLVCNANSPHKTISDIAGAKVMIKENTVAAILAKYEMMKSGVIEKVKLIDAGTVDQDWLPEAVRNGMVDVTAIPKENLAAAKGLRALQECPALPGFVWLAGRKTRPEVVARFAGALTEFNPAEKLNQPAAIALGLKDKGFIKLGDGDMSLIARVVSSGVERFKGERKA